MSYNKTNKIRDPVIAGIFYPDDKDELISALDLVIEKAKSLLPTNRICKKLPAAIISPHAAFQYSASIQAIAWTAISQCAVKNIVIIAPLPSKDDYGIFLPESDIFATVLGDVEINTSLCTDLESCSTLFKIDDIPHLESHAIEMQLLFMKKFFPNAKLVPVLVGGDISPVVALGRAIDIVFTDSMDSTLFVASSNMVSSSDARESDILTEQILTSISAGNWLDILSRKYLTGKDAIASLMSIRAIEKIPFTVLTRADSRSTVKTPNHRVVNYAAALWNKLD